ncbi:hypothetical protein LshimejAT787_0302530 [Lyophyllum shimeji]|uniref:DNA replication regulator SLD2 n=1 Tax=Lyophyllum shimeji TaxID=47721 RepID=A0A9P3ULS8_LYOSH|nr:hypothetical protein LshimejAT787_0302530 [Lyophyllum shimeji]
MDVSTVKAEIKAWERSFKSSHGRDPTIQDIKLQPDIANKYRLYKKLSKTSTDALPSASTSSHTSSDLPSTPPRSRPRSHQLVPTLLTQPRVIETTAPLSSFNPFSPQKNNGKGKVLAAQARPHSFASPFKSTAPLVEPFPLLNVPKPPATSVTPPHSPLTANSAVSRARKRLRGEPVSPSPIKGKRRRVGSQTILPFAKLASDSSSSEDESENAINSSIVSDSPVKVPAGGMSFKLLFDETGGTKNKAPLMRMISISSARGLFGEKSKGGVDDDAIWDLDDAKLRSGKGKHTGAPHKPCTALSVNGSTHVSKPNVVTDQQMPRKTAKRTLSDAESEVPDTPHETLAGPSLIPPSPPPANSSTYKSRQSASTKAKGLPTGRKKAKTVTDPDKLDDKIDGDAEDSDELKPNVKIIDRMQTRFRRTASTEADGGEYDLDSDPDPILGYSGRAAPRVQEATLPPNDAGEGKFEVDLPDELRRVLALDAKELKIRDSREERLVQGLVSGRRTCHYDPARGGEIWDVGEDDLRYDEEEVIKRDTEGEDEWEGEPVPWEVGEL